MLESNLAEYSMNNKIRSDPMPLPLSFRMSESSSTPLLQRQSAMRTPTGQDRPSPLHGQQAVTDQDSSLYHLQTPYQPISFRPEESPFPRLDGVHKTCQQQEGLSFFPHADSTLLVVADGPASSKVVTPSLGLSEQSREGLSQEQLTTPQPSFSDVSPGIMFSALI